GLRRGDAHVERVLQGREAHALGRDHAARVPRRPHAGLLRVLARQARPPGVEQPARGAREDGMLRRGILAALAAAAVLGAAAEPRIPDLEANLAERIAHSDFVFMWDIDSDT